MTREQRDAAKQRLELLESRMEGISALTDNGCPIEMDNIMQPIIKETKADIAALQIHLATKWEFLFNFIGGGWNSEVAFTKEDAIEQALFNYGHPDTQEHLRVDTSTFRVSTPEDYKNQLSSFY